MAESLLRLGEVPTGPRVQPRRGRYRATGTALDYMVVGRSREAQLHVRGVRCEHRLWRRAWRAEHRPRPDRCRQLRTGGGGRRRRGGATRQRFNQVRCEPTLAARAAEAPAPWARRATSAPHSLEPAAFVSVAEGSEGPARAPLGLSAGLGGEEHPFDCVAFFNPTTDDYEVTVNGWADALLVMINATVWSAESGAK